MGQLSVSLIHTPESLMVSCMYDLVLVILFGFQVLGYKLLHSSHTRFVFFAMAMYHLSRNNNTHKPFTDV